MRYTCFVFLAQLLPTILAARPPCSRAVRADSLGQFCVALLLDEGNPGGGVPSIQSFVMRPGRYSYFSGKVRCDGMDGWQRFEHHVATCPKGFRRALVLIRGRRAGQPPGTTEAQTEALPVFSGAKFACAELVFE